MKSSRVLTIALLFLVILLAVGAGSMVFAASANIEDETKTMLQQSSNIGTWHPTGGLEDGKILSLVIDHSNPDTTLYAGTFGSGLGKSTDDAKTSYNGVYKSTDGGKHWSPVNNGLPDTYADYVLAIDSSNPHILYVGSSKDGLFKSTNGGDTWEPANNGVTRIHIHMAPVIDWSDSNRLYLGTEGPLLRSTDGGKSWSPANDGLGENEVAALAIDPSNAATLYAGAHYSEGYNEAGVFKSTDGGKSWTPVKNGLPDPASAASNVSCLAIHKTDSETVYAATLGAGVFKTINGGESWSPINDGLTNTIVGALVFDPSNPATLYAGTYGGGVFQSTNGGESWSPVNSGLTNTLIIPLVFDSSTPARLFAGTDGSGVFKTVNPTAPTGLTATPTSSNQIVLGWTDPCDNESGFKIERKTGNCASTNAWVQIATKGANVTTHTNTGLSANKTYAYRIRAYNGTGNSDYSVCRSATTGLAGTPVAATGLTATSVSASKISLKWTDNSNNETGFKIYRKKDSDPWTLLLTTDMNVKQYDDASAAGNNTTSSYRYYLTACNSVGCSPPTSTPIVPFKPDAPKATPSAGKIDLKWTDKSGNESGFQVYKKGGSCGSTSSWEPISTTAANIHAFSDTEVASGAPYSYKVRAFVQSAARPYTAGYSLHTGCVSATAP